MKISALLTSAGINIGLCVLFLSLYSVLRKQPANVRVYFGRRIAEENERLRGAFILERFVPSTGWIVKALQCPEEEILAAAGLDAVVFNRILVFSQLNVLSSPKDIPVQLARAIPGQATFFITYVLTSGWASLSSELMQLFVAQCVSNKVIGLGVFGLKESPVAAGFTIPLIILTLLFNQYCRNRLLPLFRTFPAQDLIDMDREDERSGRIDEIHHQLHSAYCQFPDTEDVPLEKIKIVGGDEEQGSSSSSDPAIET
nr:unnamed protein product [Digitaria exilis]